MSSWVLNRRATVDPDGLGKIAAAANEVTRASRQQIVRDLVQEAAEVRPAIEPNSQQCQDLPKRSERIKQQMHER